MNTPEGHETEISRIRGEYGKEAAAALERAFIAGVNLGSSLVQSGANAGSNQVQMGMFIGSNMSSERERKEIISK